MATRCGKQLGGIEKTGVEIPIKVSRLETVRGFVKAVAEGPGGGVRWLCGE